MTGEKGVAWTLAGEKAAEAVEESIDNFQAQPKDKMAPEPDPKPGDQ